MLTNTHRLQLQSLDQTRQAAAAVFREVDSGGRDVLRATGRFARDTVTSPWVQRVVIGATLLGIAGVLLYIPAVLGYVFFYYRYLPELETTAPVHLQYGYVGPSARSTPACID